MSTVKIYPKANQVINNAKSSSEVWISDPQPLVYNNKNDQKFSVVYLPSAKKSYIIERTYTLGFLNSPDANRTIATIGSDGKLQIDPSYPNKTPELTNALKNDINLRSSLFDTRRNTVVGAFRQKNNGKTPSENQINQLLTGSTNPTTDDDGGGGGNGDGDASEDQGLKTENITKENEALNTTITNLTTLTNAIKPNSAQSRSADLENGLSYPEKFPDGMDYIIFSAKEYGTKTFSAGTFGFGKRINEDIKESVKLPIQPSISDSNSVGWNEQTFNPAQIVGANLAVGGITGGITGFIDSLDANIKAAQANPQDISSAIVAYFTQQATGAQILPKIGGAVFNQNTELLFQGPQLRPFNFTFKLSPRSKTEAERVKKIIGFFKRNMAPKTTSSQLYLKSPNVFGITYFHDGGENHSGISLIKDCALQSCTVNYTPEGSYMAFKDGAMTSYEITLQFMELEPIYASDYDEGPAANHSIGY